MKKLEKDITLDQAGTFIFYTYRIFKILIFLFNIFVIYKCLNHEPTFLIFSIILNIIYLLLYIDRIWAILVAGIVGYYFTNDIWQTTCLALAGGNSISYIIDFIIITIFSLFIRIVNHFDKNKGK